MADTTDIKPNTEPRSVDLSLATGSAFNLCVINAPARCRKCGCVVISPTTGKLRNDCGCGGELVTCPQDMADRATLDAWSKFTGEDAEVDMNRETFGYPAWAHETY